jgi:hypothetical protein
MKLQVVARGQFPAPRIVDNHRCSELGSLHHRLHFATILPTFTGSFREEELNSAPFVSIAALEEGVSVKEELQTIFGRPAFEEIITDGLGHKHDRKEKTQLGHKVQMIESYDTRAVDRTAARPHSNQF